MPSNRTAPGPRAEYAHLSRQFHHHIACADNRTAELDGRADALKQAKAIARQLDELDERRIVLPERGWMRWMRRGLGPSPDVDRPTQEEFTDLRRYRLLPYLTLLVPIAGVFTVSQMAPATLVSPVTATGQAVAGDQGQQWASYGLIVLIGALVLAALTWLGPTRLRAALWDLALDEELIFRFGSEQWTRWQRTRSCLQFGVAHLVNLVVALVTLGALALVGAVFMWVYLREVRAHGDPRRAAATAAHFHADYNWGAVLLILLALLLTLGTALT